MGLIEKYKSVKKRWDRSHEKERTWTNILERNELERTNEKKPRLVEKKTSEENERERINVTNYESE